MQNEVKEGVEGGGATIVTATTGKFTDNKTISNNTNTNTNTNNNTKIDHNNTIKSLSVNQ